MKAQEKSYRIELLFLVTHPRKALKAYSDIFQNVFAIREKKNIFL